MSFSLQCTCRNFGACGFQVQKDREGIKVIKDGGRQKKQNNNNNQKKNSKLGPSAIFTGADNYLSAEL